MNSNTNRNSNPRENENPDPGSEILVVTTYNSSVNGNKRKHKKSGNWKTRNEKWEMGKMGNGIYLAEKKRWVAGLVGKCDGCWISEMGIGMLEIRRDR